MPANKPVHERDLLDSISQHLDDSVDALDAVTLSKLNQARHRALETKASHVPNWLPSGAFAAVFIAIAAGWLFTHPPAFMQTPEATALLSDEDIEMIDDLEFVSWLVEQDDAGS